MDNMQEIQKVFFKKLIDGDFGLAKTYWFYGVLVGFIGQIVMLGVETSESIALVIITILVALTYNVCQMIGTWNAANRYTGSKIWTILAKITVALGVMAIIFTIIILTNL